MFYSIRKIVSGFLFFLICLSNLIQPALSQTISVIDPNTLPADWTVRAGNVSINTNGNVMNVNSASEHSIVDWGSLSLGRDAFFNVNQNSNAVHLSRVVGPSISEIYGSINSPGKVFLVNPNGIFFGRTAQVNVGGLFASTLGISDSDFMNRNYRFFNNGSKGQRANVATSESSSLPDGQPAAGVITNEGNINASLVGLFGSAISNSGNINVGNGQAHLAVGNKIEVNLGGNLSMEVKVTEALKEKVANLDSAIKNSGTIKSNGNLIKLQTALQEALYSTAINNEGIIEANGLNNNNGVIELVSSVGVQGTVPVQVRNNNGTPNMSSDDFNETKNIVVEKLSQGGNVKNSGLLNAKRIDSKSGTFENQLENPLSLAIIQGSSEVKLHTNGQKSAVLEAADQTVKHGLASEPADSRFKTKTVEYGLLNEGGIINASNVSLEAADGKILNRNKDLRDGSITANSLSITARELVNEQTGFTTRKVEESQRIDGDNHKFEIWTDEAGSSKAIIGGDRVNIKANKLENKAGIISANGFLEIQSDDLSNEAKVLQKTTKESWKSEGLLGSGLFAQTRKKFYHESLPVNVANGLIESQNSNVLITGLSRSTPITPLVQSQVNNTGLIRSLKGDVTIKTNSLVNGIQTPEIQDPNTGLIPGTILGNTVNLSNAKTNKTDGRLRNTGLISSNNDLNVSFGEISNEKRTAQDIENVKTYGGFGENVVEGGANVTAEKFDELQRGGILTGRNTRFNGTKLDNKGGLISADNNLQINVDEIINQVTRAEKVVTWSPQDFGKLLGMDSHSTRAEFVPGIITADNIQTVGKTLLNKGSDIFGKREVSLKASDWIEQDWLVEDYRKDKNLSLSPLAFLGIIELEGKDDKEFVFRKANIFNLDPNGNIRLETKGTFRNRASEIASKNDLTIFAGDVELKPGIEQTTDKSKDAGHDIDPKTRSLTWTYKDTKQSQTLYEPTRLQAGKTLDVRAASSATSSNIPAIPATGKVSIEGSELNGRYVNLDGNQLVVKPSEYTEKTTTTGFSNSAFLTQTGVGGSISAFNASGKQEIARPSSIIGENINLNFRDSIDINASKVKAAETLTATTKDLKISGKEVNFDSQTDSVSGGVTFDIQSRGLSIFASYQGSVTDGSEYISSELTGRNVNLNAQNKSIEGTLLNGQGINPKFGKAAETNTFGATVAYSVFTFTPSVSLNYNDIGISSAIGPNGGSIGVTYRGAGGGINFSEPQGSLGSRTGIFATYQGLGTIGWSTGSTVGESAHDVDSINFSFLGGVSGGAAFQDGHYVGASLYNPIGDTLWLDQNSNFNYTCFVAGTPITLADGSTKSIEKLKVGEKVLSVDQANGKLESKAIKQTFIREAKKIVKLTLSNGAEIETTPDHPFYLAHENQELKAIAETDWVDAGKLKVGDKLLQSNLQQVEIAAIEEEAGTTVYNFEVEDNHNYFAKSILVHNITPQYNGTDANNFNQSFQEPGGQVVLNGAATQFLDPTGREITEAQYKALYRQSLSDLKTLTRGNGNLTEAQKQAYIQRLEAIELDFSNASSSELDSKVQQYSQEIRNIKFQVNLNQYAAALDSGITFQNARNEFSGVESSLNALKDSVLKSTTLTEAEKAQKVEALNGVQGRLEGGIAIATARDAGLIISSAVATGALAAGGAAVSAAIAKLGTSGYAAVTGLTLRYGAEVANNVLQAIENPGFYDDIVQGNWAGVALEVLGGGPLGEAFGQFVKNTPIIESGLKLISKTNFDKYLDNAIALALNSGDSAKILEGNVAKFLKNQGVDIVSFDKTIRDSNRTIGQVDLETSKYIIEITEGNGQNKLAQAQRFLDNNLLNPKGKEVIVYGPEIRGTVERNLNDIGVRVFRTLDDLNGYLKN